ncbi:GNAT family N-acetyltransferase [Phototrophicus methaneseepsis]|uniref:GNAT family N-acetyltransferase n=1 Tax=Phototrophicus methaneseepsis TaxID=2710758 RepID=A0A7S8E9Y5_9CHLR|nr:GNAT family N-acetyltransferase [Phototrophicus methaneseepsis]QPC82969.1 GNAT family N-acetyltransferase [Phototrophicus methaneseepsis]
MIRVVPAYDGPALEHVITLSTEYVTWMMGQIPGHFPNLDLSTFSAEHEYDDIHKKFPGAHRPPDGCLLLALRNEAACGCIALGRLSERICEMRTLYVRPACRGEGIGRILAHAALDEARKLGYERVRLDTLQFMASALRLYRSLGFYDIAPYNDLPDDLKPYICFLECQLNVPAGTT